MFILLFFFFLIIYLKITDLSFKNPQIPYKKNCFTGYNLEVSLNIEYILSCFNT